MRQPKQTKVQPIWQLCVSRAHYWLLFIIWLFFLPDILKYYSMPTYVIEIPQWFPMKAKI